MAASRELCHVQPKDQAKALARLTPTMEAYDEELRAMATRIASRRHPEPLTLALKSDVEHEFHLRRG